MYDNLKNGKTINLISPGTIKHDIDDKKENMLSVKEAGLLVVDEATTVRVTLLNGRTETLTNYNNYPACYVIKVWATGTSDSTRIKLWE